MTDLAETVFMAGILDEAMSQRLGERHAWGSQPDSYPSRGAGIAAQPEYRKPIDEATKEQYNFLASLDEVNVQALVNSIEATLAALPTEPAVKEMPVSLPKPTADKKQTCIRHLRAHREHAKRLLEHVGKVKPRTQGIQVLSDALQRRINIVIAGIDGAIDGLRKKEQFEQKKRVRQSTFNRS
jgi:hypothetical protein